MISLTVDGSGGRKMALRTMVVRMKMKLFMTSPTETGPGELVR